MSKPLTVQQFFTLFPDDNTCLDHLWRTRYGEIDTCPKCEKVTKFHRVSAEWAYSCQWCGHHIHPMVGTPFEQTHMPLQNWFYAMYLFTATRHGVSAKELQRQFGCSYKSAWRMGHEIRKYMTDIDDDGSPLSGEVEIDETYVGGRQPGKKGRGAAGKVIVMGLQERGGDIRTEVVPDVRKDTLEHIIEDNVEVGSTIHTDEMPSYNKLPTLGYEHKTVEHGAKEWARDGSRVNTLEAFWLILKRSIRSTHVSVSKKHMPKYLGEFSYRQNRRKAPRQMFLQMLAFPRAT